MEDMGNDPHREAATCAHVALGARETTHLAQVGDQYAAKHNPFVYFHSIIDDRAGCDAHVVNLTRLPQDLKQSATTANYIFITPNLCSDGHDAVCVDGRRGGLAAIDEFLKKWVPLITRSPAFLADGLAIVTFDESDAARRRGLERLLWRAAASGGDIQAWIRRTGRRTDRRRVAITVCETRNRERGALQPLFAAANRGGNLRAAAARLRCRAQPEGVRAGRLHRRRAASTRSIRSVTSGFLRSSGPRSPAARTRAESDFPAEATGVAHGEGDPLGIDHGRVADVDDVRELNAFLVGPKAHPQRISLIPDLVGEIRLPGVASRTSAIPSPSIGTISAGSGKPLPRRALAIASPRQSAMIPIKMTGNTRL